MGREQKRATATVWRSRLAKFRRSNVTVVEFCRREGVSDASFYLWRKRLGQVASRPSRRTRSHGSASSNGTRENPFVPVRVLSSPVAELELPNGVRIRVPADNAEELRAAVLAGSDLCRETPRC